MCIVFTEVFVLWISVALIPPLLLKAKRNMALLPKASETPLGHALVDPRNWSDEQRAAVQVSARGWCCGCRSSVGRAACARSNRPA